MATLTVIRLPNPGNRRDPLERVMSTLGRVDLALTDELHQANQTRPFAVVRRRDTLDLIAFRDDLAQALLKGEPDARLICRRTLADLVTEHSLGGTLRLAFETPTWFRVAGFDHMIPDPFHLFGSLRDRWQALGWPELPTVTLRRVPVWPEQLTYGYRPRAGHEPQRGFVGSVRLGLVPLDEAERAVLWTLARFGEYRGVGRGTSYGFGRIRILHPGERWVSNCQRSVWDGG